MDCDNDALTEANIDRLVTGRLSKLGSDLVLTLKLSRLDNSSFAAAESCVAENRAALKRCASGAAVRLFDERRATISYPPLKGATLAVLSLDTYDVSASLGSTLTELVLLEVKRLEGTSVISQQEVTAMMGYEAQRQIATCENDVECLIEIAGVLDTEYVLGGTIGKLDDTFLIQLKLMNIREAAVERRTSESLVGQERDLAAAIRLAARRLLGAKIDGPGHVQVMLDRDADDALVSIDGRAPQPLETVATATIAGGKHTISIRADGYEPLHREFIVEPGGRTSVRGHLEPIPSEWYEAWWFWSIVGGVAVVGTGAAVLATRSQPPGMVGGPIAPPLR